ncbi:MAG: hypothetical protein GY754_18790 [bacterium]|nr:hypothetical protein [bacterium]MCP4133020.1 hypothetical protein [bacterium]
MKKFKIVVVVLAMLAFIPASSYAFFDAGVYGGYSFGKGIENTTETAAGFEWGAIAHWNTSIIPLVLSFGLGGYFEMSYLSYDLGAAGSIDLDRTAAGIDMYVQSELPIIVHPYVHGKAAAYEKLQVGTLAAETQYFKSYAVGVGVAVSLFIPLIQAFGQYDFNFDTGSSTTGHAFHLGLRVKL